MRNITIKEGPLVFIRNVLSMEIIAAILFFGLSFVGNYGTLYQNWVLSDYIRFDIFEVFVFHQKFSSFQAYFL